MASMRRRPAAAGGVIRRPAAAPGLAAGPGRRRPGAEVGEEHREGSGPEDAKARYNRGEEVRAHLIPPGSFSRGDWIVAEEATYYQKAASVAAKAEREELEGGDRELRAFITGTRSEELLKFGTSQTPCQIRLHLWSPSCNGLRENPDLVHVRKLKKIRAEDPKDWQVNLTEDPETQLVRADQEEWERREEEKRKAAHKEKKKSSSSTEARRERKRKRKRRRKRKRKWEILPGQTNWGVAQLPRSPSSPSIGGQDSIQTPKGGASWRTKSEEG